jgi:hypothetical protein
MKNASFERSLGDVEYYGNRVKLLRLTPEPKPLAVGIIAPKGRLIPRCGTVLAVRQASGLGNLVMGGYL